MTIQQVLNSVFPSGVLTQLVTEDLGAFEITGLPKNSQPQNCKILARGQDAAVWYRREFFLVRATDGTVLFFSIIAEPNYDYEEFVTGHGFALPEQGDRAIELDTFARKRIEIFSHQEPSSIH
jgi:hypothetical protein